jgi:pimeloyl-ACP methyl ester carboxylesterase
VLERLEGRLERLVADQGRPAAIVGQSRGGGLAKALGRRRPDLVAGVIALGSPHLEPLAVHPLVRLQVVAIGGLGTLGAPRLFKRSCLEGSCCAAFWSDLAAPLPDDVRLVSIYSRTDGIVDWQACLDPHADALVEIDASHCGMAVSPAAWRAVADALEGFERVEAGRRQAKKPARARLRRVA